MLSRDIVLFWLVGASSSWGLLYAASQHEHNPQTPSTWSRKRDCYRHTFFFCLLESGMCISDASFDDGSSLLTNANVNATGRGTFCVTYCRSYDTFLRRRGSYLGIVVTACQFSAIETRAMDLIKFKVQDLLWGPTSLLFSGYWFLFLPGVKRLGRETGNSHQSIT